MGAAVAEDRGEYCRQIETHLSRRNAGHLVRIVGPAFEMVSGWAERGIPLSVALRGIDRCLDRLLAKGPRRRPVPVQFCEADVLDLFDEWRRATGISDVGAGPVAPPEPDIEPRRHGSLAAHLERVIARLTTLRGAGILDNATIDRVVRELDTMRSSVRTLRGASREEVLDRLRTLDAELLVELRRRAGDPLVQEVAREADRELAPYRARMPADAYERAQLASRDRLLRDRLRTPVVAFD